jgi:hypothetical protein
MAEKQARQNQAAARAAHRRRLKQAARRNKAHSQYGAAKSTEKQEQS